MSVVSRLVLNLGLSGALALPPLAAAEAAPGVGPGVGSGSGVQEGWAAPALRAPLDVPLEPLAVERRPALGDVVERVDGGIVRGQVTDVVSGAYVTVITAAGPETIPWAELRQVSLDRDPGPSMVLDLSRATLGPEQIASRETPHVTILTRDGRPVSLLRLRSGEDKMRRRYSTGYDEVCRAPCMRPVVAGSRRFFVDSNPWTASKIFELPDADYVELTVRPGRVRMRRAGIGMMIGGGIGTPLGIILLSGPTQNRTRSGLGIALLTVALTSIPVGWALYAVSRAKAKAKARTGP